MSWAVLAWARTGLHGGACVLEGLPLCAKVGHSLALACLLALRPADYSAAGGL